MGVFKKGQGLDPKRLKRTKFPLPECVSEDGKETFIFLRPVTAKEGLADAKEREAFEAAKEEAVANGTEPPKEDERSMYKLVARCACDETGEPLFADATEAEAELDCSADSLIRMLRKICEISGIGTIEQPRPAKN